MNSISQSVPKRDHGEKVSGRAVYTADYPNTDLLTARVLRSTKPHAVIRDVAVPELPEGYFYVDHRDIPARNQVQMGLGDTPVFAVEEVRYIGDPIGLIVGPDPETVDRILHKPESDCGFYRILKDRMKHLSGESTGAADKGSTNE